MPRAHRFGSAVLSLATPLVIGVATTSNAQVRSVPPESTNPSQSTEAATTQVDHSAGTAHSRHWTLEFRGGLGLPSKTPASGTGQLPAAGASILPAGSQLPPARAASSWLFGDGAAQLNAFGGQSGGFIPALSTLNGVLTSLGANRDIGGTLGFTMSRGLSAHWSADVSLDADLQQLGMTSAATTAMSITRTDFVATMQPVLFFFTGSHTGPVVTATMTGPTSTGRQIEAFGTLTYRLKPRLPVDPFVLFGGGIITSTGGTPAVVLTGDYQGALLAPVPVPFHETDTVTIGASDGGSRPVGVLGAGVDHALSVRGGLRLTVRAVIGANDSQTILDAAPTRQLSSQIVGSGAAFVSNNASTLIISNNLLSPSTLSGPPITGFRTFVGKGVRIDSAVTLGYFFRF